jgi:phage terminase large subunit-like protein
MNGVTQPRIFTPPLRKLNQSTSLGYACIEYAEKVLRKELYPWQKFALIHALEIAGSLKGKWTFRFRTVLFLISRQNGKTVLSEVIASFFLNMLGVESVFGTSLSLDKAEEVWEAVIRDQEDIPDLSQDIERVSRTNGNKRLILTDGRQYKVGAPTRRAGRGDSNDLVMLDEIREHRDWETWSAAAASTVAKPNGIIMCFSNAGDPDSIVLRQLRSQAVAAIDGKEAQNFGGEVDSKSLGLFEWSAPDGAKTDDMKALAQANPALGYGLLTERALMSNRSTFPENKFRSECMCQQVETILPQPFPDGAWDACLDMASNIPLESDVYFGIDLSEDRRWTSIGVCGLRSDGNWHIEVVARAVGTEWAIDWFRARAMRGKIRLAFQGRGAPVTGLAEQICSIQGVERFAIEGSDLSASWGRFWDGVAASDPATKRGGTKIFHLQQPVLDTPAKTMQLRQMGGGVALPDRRKSPDDIAPLFACIMAFAAATKTEKENAKTYESAYAREGYSLVFC